MRVPPLSLNVPNQPRGLRVLIVEDDDNDAELMKLELRRSGLVESVTRIQSEEEFQKHLNDLPDAILSDYTLPSFGASRALEICRERGLDIPFIVVTGSISEEVAVDCMKRGAADYLLKDRLARLASALEQAVKAKRARDLKARAEQARDAAMSELDHRVRNNLGVVLGLAELTARSCAQLSDFSSAFLGRVRALATVHDALGERHWLDVDLHSLVSRVVQMQTISGEGRIALRGPQIAISSIAVQPLGLVIHEIARNAGQHGAWSVPEGRASLDWSAPDGEMVHLVWQEAGGPSPPRSPQLRAGLNLVQDLVRYELRGSSSFEFAPTGLRVTLDCRLCVPVSSPFPLPDATRSQRLVSN